MHSPGATETRLFGVPLDSVLKRPIELAGHSKIPLQIAAVIQTLTRLAPAEEGIFRIPGLHKRLGHLANYSGLKADIDSSVKVY